jgi:hypothetical protein
MRNDIMEKHEANCGSQIKYKSWVYKNGNFVNHNKRDMWQSGYAKYIFKSCQTKHNEIEQNFIWTKTQYGELATSIENSNE